MSKVAIWLHELTDADGELLVGGVQTYVLQLAESFGGYNDSVTVVYPGPSARNLPDLGGNVSFMAVPGSSWWRGSKAVSVIADVHVVANCHARPRTLDRTVVGIQHGVYWDRPASRVRVPEGLSRLANLARASRGFGVIRGFDHLVCVDYNFPNAAAALNPPFAWDRIEVIPNFAPQAPLPSTFDAPIRGLTFSRRFTSHRGTGILIETVRRLREAGWSLPVRLFGSGPDEGLLREAFRGDASVEFDRLPFHDRLEAFTPDSLSIVPSLSTEGTSLSCLEAWARGSLVVSSPAGGLSNLVLNGVTGFVAPPVSGEFARAIVRVVRMGGRDVARIRQTAYEASQGPFGLAAWEGRWRDLIRRVLSGQEE